MSPRRTFSYTTSIALLLAACGGQEIVPQWHDGGGYRWRELIVPRRGGPGFTQLAPAETGLDFSNAVTREQTIANSHLTHGSGVALGDVDGDGLTDIYVGRIEGPNVLYRNLGGWRFEDVTAAAGVAAPDQFTTGVAFADTDGDGDLDILVAALGGPNSLFVNDGAGQFAERPDAGLESDRASTTMTLADVDGDADLDLYVANYKLIAAEDFYSPSERSFERVVQQIGEEFTVKPEFQEHFRVEVIRGADRPLMFPVAEPDWFYLNDGTGRFEAVPFAAERFLNADGTPLAAEPAYFGLAARFYDVDGDGDPDLYICNDFGDPDAFWINDGSGTFRAAPPTALRNTSNSAMAVDFADVDRDGHVDFFQVDMLSRDRRLRHTQMPAHRPFPKVIGQIENRPQMQQNALFLNRGDATFAQIAWLAGVAASEWSWATMFLDVDLDGYEDILVANGHMWDVMDFDTEHRLVTLRTSSDTGASSMLGGLEWREERLLFPDLRLKNIAFRNNGDLTFDEVSDEWGFSDHEDLSHGLAAADLDGDGDLDVVINRLSDPLAVFRNDATAPRVAVRLIGQAPNTQAVGAKIRIVGGPVPMQEKEVTLGGMYLSSSDPLYTFAAGKNDELTIEVTWRSGARTSTTGVGGNRLYEIREGAAISTATERTLEEPRDSEPALFVDASAELEHHHVDEPFDDIRRQPLLPNRLTELGPGVTWHDVDDDGDEDLLIASGRGGRLSYYRNEAGHLRPVPLRMDPTPLDQSTVLALPDGAGHTSLLVGQTNYESATLEDALAASAVLRLDFGAEVDSAAALTPETSSAVSGTLTSIGPLALADYDGDGDLDLFVGGRVIPTRYPEPAASRLYRNTNGAFALDARAQQALGSAGLVSGATFSDVDGDGDPDLLLAAEWSSPKLFRNDGGQFTDATDAWGLTSQASRWNGIATGDLNGDGRPDLIVTSWGRNTTLRPSERRPVYLYYGDFDRSGTADLLTAQADRRRGPLFPLESPIRVRRGLPGLLRRLRTLEAYANATLEDVIVRRDFPRHEITSLDHMAFLNTGRSFTPVSLPTEAQFAPASYAGIADFDGDGHEDVFLSQNFFPTEVGTPRYDAGRGLLLKGDGSGGLTPMSASRSGIIVYGDQRGAAFADLDGDGRLDLVVSQNGAATKLYRNVGAAPGLRVRIVGTAANPAAVGATIRLVYEGGLGPAREIQAGSGYWSQNGAVQVFSRVGEPKAVWVRWPDGRETETPIPEGSREVTVRVPEGL